jgi:hypothetical protein
MISPLRRMREKENIRNIMKEKIVVKKALWKRILIDNKYMKL